MFASKTLWYTALGLLLFVQKAQTQSDTLPFPIHQSKKLSLKRLETKKEGWVLTGVPRLSYDPVQGMEFGANAQVFYHKNAQDPFFEYTPYRYRNDVSVKYGQFGKVAIKLSTDAPYFLDSKWRLRVKVKYEDNPNKLYFPLGAKSLNNLQYRSEDGTVYRDLSYGAYQSHLKKIRSGIPERGEVANQDYTDVKFNDLAYREYVADVLLERTFWAGNLRFVGGFDVAYLSYETYDFKRVEGAVDANGNTQMATNGVSQFTLDHQQAQRNPENSFWAKNNITGYNGGFLLQLKTGLIYDTRDFEPDPTKGALMEYSLSHSAAYLASDFNYFRHQFQAQYFVPVFSFLPNKNILASRIMLSSLEGKAVFFKEVTELWSASQGRIEVFGGEDALRGYKNFRFGGMLYGFANVELRSGLFNFTKFKQAVKVSMVTFVDGGRVWDSFQQLSNWQQLKFSPGFGLRFAWNQNTILRADFAFSQEDQQLFLAMGHVF